MTAPAFSRLCASLDREHDPVYLPLVVRGVEHPLTVYRPSQCHDSYLVVYDPGTWAPSRSAWIVPGTHAEQ